MLEGPAKVGAHLTAIVERTTAAGGHLHASPDAMRLNENARSATGLQDLITPSNALLPPASGGSREFDNIHEFAVTQSQVNAFSAAQIAIGTHAELADVMPSLATLHLNSVDHARPSQQQLLRLSNALTTFSKRLAIEDLGTITFAQHYLTATVGESLVPLIIAPMIRVGFAAAAIGVTEVGGFARRMIAIGRGATENPGVSNAHAKNGVLELTGALTNLAQWIDVYRGLNATELCTEAFGTHAAKLQNTQSGKLGCMHSALQASSGSDIRAHRSAGVAAGMRYQLPADKFASLNDRLADVTSPPLVRRMDGSNSRAHTATAFLARHQALAGVLASPKSPALPAYEAYRIIDEIKDVAGGDAYASARFFIADSHVPEGPLRHLSMFPDISMRLTPISVIVQAAEMTHGLQPIQAPVLVESRIVPSASRREPSPTVAQPITINVSYSVNAASPQEWIKAARQHADELMRIMESKLARRSRLEFA